MNPLVMAVGAVILGGAGGVALRALLLRREDSITRHRHALWTLAARQRPCPGTGQQRKDGKCPACRQPVKIVMDYDRARYVVALHPEVTASR